MDDSQEEGQDQEDEEKKKINKILNYNSPYMGSTVLCDYYWVSVSKPHLLHMEQDVYIQHTLLANLLLWPI